MADQNSGLVDLYSRKGKGRAANGDRPIGAASCRQEEQTQGNMRNPPPLHPLKAGHGGKMMADGKESGSFKGNGS